MDFSFAVPNKDKVDLLTLLLLGNCPQPAFPRTLPPASLLALQRLHILFVLKLDKKKKKVDIK